ncbi:MAG TPA: FAD binding domain-containing protein [Stellaceae bacterium]|nr:FAD binding domain-containing protein [Stellaceae bacterium]
MKPASFDYLRPETLDEALAALGELGGDARVLAGGQSLMPMLNMRLVQPQLLVDIGRLAGLAEVRLVDGRLMVGAAVTQAQLATRPTLAAEAPLLAAALPWVGHYQTRNRGTICGSIAHADPSAELPLCLLALGGDVVLRSASGRRIVSGDDFLLGVLSTDRRDDELVEAVRFPLRQGGAGIAFREVAQRHGDFAIVACAAIVRPAHIRLAIGGVAGRPMVREWPSDLGDDSLDDALNAFAWELGAVDDLHASARYRRELVRRMGRRTIEEARQCRG